MLCVRVCIVLAFTANETVIGGFAIQCSVRETRSPRQVVLGVLFQPASRQGGLCAIINSSVLNTRTMSTIPPGNQVEAGV